MTLYTDRDAHKMTGFCFGLERNGKAFCASGRGTGITTPYRFRDNERHDSIWSVVEADEVYCTPCERGLAEWLGLSVEEMNERAVRLSRRKATESER